MNIVRGEYSNWLDKKRCQKNIPRPSHLLSTPPNPPPHPATTRAAPCTLSLPFTWCCLSGLPPSTTPKMSCYYVCCSPCYRSVSTSYRAYRCCSPCYSYCCSPCYSYCCSPCYSSCYSPCSYRSCCTRYYYPSCCNYSYGCC